MKRNEIIMVVLLVLLGTIDFFVLDYLATEYASFTHTVDRKELFFRGAGYALQIFAASFALGRLIYSLICDKDEKQSSIYDHSTMD